jgi:hypothetical protein
VSDVIDERNCCLQDLQGRNLHGLFNVKRLKRAYFRTHTGTATNIKDVKNAVELMDAQRIEMPELKVEARGLMCMADNTQPPMHDLNQYCQAEMGSEPLTPFYDILLASYMSHEEPSNVAILRTRTRRQINKELKREKKMPVQGEELKIDKARYLLGELQLFCRYKNGKGQWFNFSCFGNPKTTELQVLPAENFEQQPTGRVLVNHKDTKATADEQKSIKTQGSTLKFGRQLTAKPSLDKGVDRQRVKRVKFNLVQEGEK